MSKKKRARFKPSKFKPPVRLNTTYQVLESGVMPNPVPVVNRSAGTLIAEFSRRRFTAPVLRAAWIAFTTQAYPKHPGYQTLTGKQADQLGMLFTRWVVLTRNGDLTNPVLFRQMALVLGNWVLFLKFVKASQATIEGLPIPHVGFFLKLSEKVLSFSLTSTSEGISGENYTKQIEDDIIPPQQAPVEDTSDQVTDASHFQSSGPGVFVAPGKEQERYPWDHRGFPRIWGCTTRLSFVLFLLQDLGREEVLALYPISVEEMDYAHDNYELE